MIRDIWEKFPGKINIKQKIILAIFVPVLLFSITYTIAYYVSYEKVVTSPSEKTSIIMDPYRANITKFLEKYRGNPDWKPGDPTTEVVSHRWNPYNWQRTWCVWFLFLTLCGIFEYKLFEDKK